MLSVARARPFLVIPKSAAASTADTRLVEVLHSRLFYHQEKRQLWNAVTRREEKSGCGWNWKAAVVTGTQQGLYLYR